MPIHVTPIPRLTVLTVPALTLGTANAAGAAVTAIASNSTLLAFDATVPDAITFGQSGAAGSATVTSRRDHAHAMAADPSGITWEGGSTTEATTTSTSYQDGVTISSLSIGATVPLYLQADIRKASGAADTGAFQFLVNGDAMITGVTTGISQAENGSFEMFIGGVSTNYTYPMRAVVVTWVSSSGAAAINTTNPNTPSNIRPIADVTEIIFQIRGRAGALSGCDNVQMYSRSTG